MRSKFLFFVLLTAIGCTAQNTCQQLAPKAIELYGCIDSLKNFPEQVNQQISGQLSVDQRMTPVEKEQFAETVRKSIRVDRLIKNVESDVIASCNASEMKKVIEQLNTPLVHKMLAYEAISNSPAGIETLNASLELPEVKSPSGKRAELIRALVKTTGAADAMVETVVETTSSMVEGMGAPPTPPEKLAEARRRIEPGVTQQINEMMLAVYHDASNEELEKYIALQGTAPFQHFNRSLSKAMVNGSATEMRFAGQALRNMMEEKKAKEEKTQPTVAPGPKK